MSSEIQALLQHATKTLTKVEEVCGALHELTVEATNLRLVLVQLGQECVDDKGRLRIHWDSVKKEFESSTKRCTQAFSDSHRYLTLYQSLSDTEKRILGVEESLPFSERQIEIFQIFRSEFAKCSTCLCELRVSLLTKSLGDLKLEMDDAGDALRFAVDKLAAQLMACGKLEDTPTRPSVTDQVLWNEIHLDLTGKGFTSSFLKLRRRTILAYVKGLAGSSAFGKANMDTFAPDSSGLNKKEAGKRGVTAETKGEESYRRKPPSRKRTLSSDEDTYRNTRRDTGKKQGFQFSDPKVVFDKLMKEESRELYGEIFMDGFSPKVLTSLDEQERRAWDRLRDLYQTLRDEYEPRYERLLSHVSERSKGLGKERVKLTHQLENSMVGELDKIQIGPNKDLHQIRKKLIDKANGMLDSLEEL